MSGLIDADALISDLEYDIKIDEEMLDYEDLTDINRKNIQNDKDCKQNAVDILKSTPTVDTVPVKPGHWDVHEDTYGDDEAKCSVCGFEMAVNQPGNGLCMISELNYCPHCGALMNEVTE